MEAAEEKLVTSENKNDPTAWPVLDLEEDDIKWEETLVLTKATEENKPDPIEQKPTEANVQNAGNKIVKLGQYEQAINEYTTAIDMVKRDPAFYTNRALCYLKLERYRECIEDCTRALAIDIRCVMAYYRRMQANECLGNLMDAHNDCTTIIMIDPKNSPAREKFSKLFKDYQDRIFGPELYAEIKPSESTSSFRV